MFWGRVFTGVLAGPRGGGCRGRRGVDTEYQGGPRGPDTKYLGQSSLSFGPRTPDTREALFGASMTHTDTVYRGEIVQAVVEMCAKSLRSS